MTFPPLDSGVWQFWGVVVGVIAIIVSSGLAVLFYLKQRSRKALTWQPTTAYSLVNSTRAFENRIRILFDNVDVPDAVLITVKMRNTGNTAIRPEDIYESIKLSFPDAEVILDALVTSASPSDAAPKVLNLGDSVMVEPFLLNPGWQFEVTCLVVGYRLDITVSGKIADVYEIKEYTESAAVPYNWRLPLAVAIPWTGALAFVAIVAPELFANTAVVIVLVSMIAVAMWSMVEYFIRRERQLRVTRLD